MKFNSGLMVGVILVAAAQGAEASSGRSEPRDALRTVYGKDDRVDLFSVQDEKVLRSADSTVMLIYTSSLEATEDGTAFATGGETLREGADVCAEEPFAEQRNPGFCSGSLVGEDIVLTAGHCIEDEHACETTSFVFGFGYKTPDARLDTVPASEVYTCAAILDRKEIDDGADYALIRLDRKVVGHQPLPVGDSSKLEAGTRLYVIGHPTGLPMKVDQGGAVRDASPADHVVAAVDTYHGNSGSPVFSSETHEIVGVLVRGEADFETVTKAAVAEGEEAASCELSKVCADGECRGEDVTRASAFSAKLAELLQARESGPPAN
jgi:V8-like Glu-specific endopeptidase